MIGSCSTSGGKSSLDVHAHRLGGVRLDLEHRLVLRLVGIGVVVAAGGEDATTAMTSDARRRRAGAHDAATLARRDPSRPAVGSVRSRHRQRPARGRRRPRRAPRRRASRSLLGGGERTLGARRRPPSAASTAARRVASTLRRGPLLTRRRGQRLAPALALGPVVGRVARLRVAPAASLRVRRTAGAGLGAARWPGCRPANSSSAASPPEPSTPARSVSTAVPLVAISDSRELISPPPGCRPTRPRTSPARSISSALASRSWRREVRMSGPSRPSIAAAWASRTASAASAKAPTVPACSAATTLSAQSSHPGRRRAATAVASSRRFSARRALAAALRAATNSGGGVANSSRRRASSTAPRTVVHAPAGGMRIASISVNVWA